MVKSLDNILEIISHFDNYPLITEKYGDFILFKQIIHKVVKGEHFSAKGLQEIVNIRASMNLGLSDSLKTSFPHTVPLPRPGRDSNLENGPKNSCACLRVGGACASSPAPLMKCTTKQPKIEILTIPHPE